MIIRIYIIFKVLKIRGKFLIFIILEVGNCDEINLVSSLDEAKNIETNTILKENDIKIIFLNSNYYYEFKNIKR